ncbi:MAG: hypothetical protein ACHQ1D_03860, partial [Nitrososphaerales archaeon]
AQNFTIPGFEHNDIGESIASLELFPNPASEEVTIRLHDVKGWSELVVADQLGQIVLRRTLQPGEEMIRLDLRTGAFNNGIFNAWVKYDEGTMISRFMVIK